MQLLRAQLVAETQRLARHHDRLRGLRMLLRGQAAHARVVLAVEPRLRHEDRKQAEQNRKADHDESTGAHGCKFLDDERSLLFAGGNIEATEVFNWCNAGGFSIYAEEGLKRYCLWKMICVVQHRGNLYRDSRLAKQLETIVPPVRRAKAEASRPSTQGRIHAAGCTRDFRDRPLGAALRRQWGFAYRLRGGHRLDLVLGRVVPRLVGARRPA
jgi:hypothetical protein